MSHGEPQPGSLSATSSKASLRLPLHSDVTLTISNSLTNPHASATTQPNATNTTTTNNSTLPASSRLDSASEAVEYQFRKQYQQRTPHDHQYHEYGESADSPLLPAVAATTANTATTNRTPQQPATATASSSIDDSTASAASKPIKRNSSLISFKSLDFNLKNIYTNIRQKSSRNNDAAAGGNASGGGGGADRTGSGSTTGGSTRNDTTSSSRASIAKTPYVRVETVDYDQSQENLLLHYHQQQQPSPSRPYMPHHGSRASFDRSPRGSIDKSPCGSQYLSASGGPSGLFADFGSPALRSPSTTSPASAYLTISQPPNVRRSSTSDICDNRNNRLAGSPVPPDARGVAAGGGVGGAAMAPASARRPSTSDLLRRARERKAGPEAVGSKIGRSISQGGIPRGGGRGGRGGRRTSIAC